MSLDKAIEHGKEHRKQYYGSKAIDATCRCHGGCPWCEGNRLHKHQKRMGVYDSIITGLNEAIEYERSKDMGMFVHAEERDYRCVHCGDDLSLEEVQYDVNGDESCENCINSYE